MIKKGMTRQIVLHYFIVVFLTILLVELVFLFAIRTYYYDGISNYLQSSFDNTRAPANYRDIVSSYSLDKAEVQVLDLKGNVLQNSTAFIVDKPVQTGDIPQALSGSTGRWIGKQAGTGEDVMAVTRMIKINGDKEYLVRYVTSLELVNQKLFYITMVSAGIGVIILIVVLMVSIGLANSIVKPINNIIGVSTLMAKGDFNVRIKGNYPHEIGELAATLNYMADEIVRSNQIKDDFISSISHELRTPLTGIKGWSETLVSGGFDPEETKLGMSIISKETERLIGLVEEMLDFSKLQQNQMKLVIGQVNLKEILQETMLNVWAKAEQKQIKLVLEPGDASYIVQADGNRLKQVFLNLVDNAIKFSPNESTIKLVIKELAPERVRIVVKDSGIGISTEFLEKVKDRFFQVNPNQGGTGLGLAITQQIVQLHKGEMHIESELDHGTSVMVDLPLLEKKPATPDLTKEAN
ncbi:sensor histidine kinase [Paenibacillus hunanensis]|uniref:histidine kinase n=1 Tax=Paenibacillus hunanensis TaxID=539262 RepID=A0ABU1J2E1_9BACL|nr:HAMP domain-containing sensor histidine kinase [Paenibacillus hunanensis]MDR6245658.1 signal transduction histidine kinase [Paenibacillus hunanensis]GGJ28280.1 sensor histidine kinase [Paenibacillus hunanensis]